MKNILSLVYICCAAICSAQSTYQARIDSLERGIKATNSNAVELKLLRSLADEGWHMTYKKQLSVAKQLLDVAQRAGRKADVADAYNELGIVTDTRWNHRKAIAYYDLALAGWKEEGDTTCMAGALCNIAVACNRMGKKEMAMDKLAEAKKLLEASADTAEKRIEYLGNVLMDIGVQYVDKGNDSTGLTYYNTAMSYFERTGNELSRLINYANMAVVYCNMQQYDTATTLVNKSMALAQKDDYKFGIMRAQVIQAMIKSKSRRGG